MKATWEQEFLSVLFIDVYTQCLASCLPREIFVGWMHRLTWQRISYLLIAIAITFQGEWISRTILGWWSLLIQRCLIPRCSCTRRLQVLRYKPWVREWSTLPAPTQGSKPSPPCPLPGSVLTSQMQIPYTLKMVRNNKHPCAPGSGCQSEVYNSSFLVPCRWQSGCWGSRSQGEGPGEWSRKALDSSHPSGKY